MRPTRSSLLFVSLALALVLEGCVKTKLEHPERRNGVASPDIEQLLAQMTLDEKVAQMTQVGWKHAPFTNIMRRQALGSVLNGGDQLPPRYDPTGWADKVDGYQVEALESRLGIPMIWGTDAVHGMALVKGGTVFPHNIGLGATRNPELVEKASRITGQEVAGAGPRWAFAPCIAVPRDERWGRTYEGFGETPELAEQMAAAAVKGLQGVPGNQDAVLACAKHFIGDGATSMGKNEGNALCSEQDLRSIHLPGYAAAIKAGVGSIMVSYSSWHGVPMHANKYLITDVLKGELAFDGFVISDWDGIDKIPGPYKDDVLKSINAGIDMVMVPDHHEEFMEDLKDHVTAGRVSMTRIDDAVRRILKQKARFKLWEHPFTNRALTEQIGSAEHRAVAREAVRQSLVLLKNERGVLPLKKQADIAVIGSKADDTGAQCGGWTLGWTGRRGANAVPGATSILQAIKKAVPKPEQQITFSHQGLRAGEGSVAVVVIGEDPYAEGGGDRDKLAVTREDEALVATAKKAGKPVVVIIVSGRPLILNSIASNADAIIAAWLPGSEGGGVADVLFGDHKPTGKLPHTWPRSMDQIPINHGDDAYDPLYPYGFGLSY